jgi:hypothetical protein
MVPGEHAFTDVGAQADPAAWVEVLDKLHREPLYAAYKRRVLELLDPQRAAGISKSGPEPGLMRWRARRASTWLSSVSTRRG